MKNIAIGIMSLTLLLLVILLGSTIYGRSARETELENALNSAMQAAMEDRNGTRETAPENDQEFAALFMERFIEQIDSRSDIKVEILSIDVKNGLLSVKATETFKHLNGNEGSISIVKTITAEEYRTGEGYCTITLNWDDTDTYGNITALSKVFNVTTGDSLALMDMSGIGTWKLSKINGTSEDDELESVVVGVLGSDGSVTSETVTVRKDDIFTEEMMQKYYIISSAELYNIEFQWIEEGEISTPVVTVTNDTAGEQHVEVNASSESPITGFYVGKENPETTQVTYSPENKTTVDSGGTWYFSVKNETGKISTISKEFYEITLNKTDDITYYPDINSVVGLKNDAITLPIAQRPGYTFAGWISDSLSEPQIILKLTENCTMTPVLNVNQYAIIFDGQGVTDNSTDNKVGTFGASVPAILIPKRAYEVRLYNNDGTNSSSVITCSYTFNGYYTEKNGKGIQYYDGSGNPVKIWDLFEDLTLYADWTAGIITLPEVTREGYDFAGWYFGTSSTAEKKENTENITISQSENLYAHWSPKKYLLSYILDGGSADNPDSYDITTKTFSLKEPIKEFYDFAGWIGSNGDTPQKTVTIKAGSTGDKSYTATWTPEVYAVYFDACGGSVPESQKFVQYGSKYGELPEATKTGDIFTGWYTESVGGELITFESDLFVNKSHTVYAHYEVMDYTIEYDLDGGMATNPLGYDQSTPDFLLNEPVKEGYDFIGWTGSNGSTPQKNVLIMQGNTGDLFYKAHWEPAKYTVSFNPNGITVEVPSISVIYGELWGPLPETTRPGYTLNGWYTESTDGEQITSDMTVDITSDMMLHAHWDANTYAVTFDAEGGEVSPETINVVYDAPYGTLPTPTKPGSVFTGWYTEKIGGEKVVETDIVNITSDVTLHARWDEIVYTISFDSNGGTTITETRQLTYGSYYDTLPLPQLAGYTFKGWYTSKDGDTKITSISKVEIASDHTLFAQWLDEEVPDMSYTITNNVASSQTVAITASDEAGIKGYYVGTATPTLSLFGNTSSVVVNVPGTYHIAAADNNGLISSVERIFYKATLNKDNKTTCAYSYLIGVEGSSLSLPAAQKTGYTHTGWKDSLTGITGTSVAFDSNRTFTAQFTANKYTVNFDPAGGTVGTTSKEVTYDSTYGTLPTPTRNGYEFLGWYTATSGGTQVVSETTVSITAEQTLHAQWKALTCTITFNPNGGSVSPTSMTATINAEIGIMPIPSRSGYIFAGWYTAASGGTNYTSTTIASGDITLYAHWTQKNLATSTSPANAWDGNNSTIGYVGGTIGGLTDWNYSSSSYAADKYVNYSYEMSYVSPEPITLSGVSIVMPSYNEVIDTWGYFTLNPAREWYSATANIFVDNVFCGSVVVAHGNSSMTYNCNFNKIVSGNSIVVRFDRNTVYEIDGSYFNPPHDQNLYAVMWEVYVSEINFK